MGYLGILLMCICIFIWIRNNRVYKVITDWIKHVSSCQQKLLNAGKIHGAYDFDKDYERIDYLQLLFNPKLWNKTDLSDYEEYHEYNRYISALLKEK